MSEQPGRVPVIDMAPFTSGDRAGRAWVVEAISRACEDIGFFILTGHGVPEDLVNHMARAARAFFDLPDASKRQVKESGAVMGGLMYFPFRTESLAATLGEVTPALRVAPGGPSALSKPSTVGACCAFRASPSG